MLKVLMQQPHDKLYKSTAICSTVCTAFAVKRPASVRASVEMIGFGRIRISEVADRAGVSRATVDRAINGRSGVSSKTRAKVEKALAELGFEQPAFNASSVSQIEILLSEGSNPFFKEIWAATKKAQAHIPASTKVSYRGFDPYRPETLVETLNSVSPSTDCVIVVGVDSPNTVRAVNSLVERGVRVVTFISDVPASKRSVFVGQDNFAAGRVAGRLLCDAITRREGQIAVMIGHLGFRHLLDRRAGFEQYVRANSKLEILFAAPYGTVSDTAETFLIDLKANSSQLCGLYLCGAGQPGFYSALRCNELPTICHELTPKSRSALLDRHLTYVVSHNLNQACENVFNAALNEKSDQVVLCDICAHVAEAIT